MLQLLVWRSLSARYPTFVLGSRFTRPGLLLRPDHVHEPSVRVDNPRLCRVSIFFRFLAVAGPGKGINLSDNIKFI